MFKRIITLLLSVGLMLSLAGCGKKVPTADSFEMGEGTVVLSEVTEDITDWKSQLFSQAKGKWVRVVLTITEGDIAFDQVKEIIITNKEVLLDDYEAVTLIASGVTIKNTSSNNMSSGTAYAVGTIHVFYDTAADYDVSKAKVTVNGVVANVISDAIPAIEK